jgi:hypothetical protein
MHDESTHEGRDKPMSWVNLSALWKVLVVGVLCGAGLPALFAVGLRGLAMRPAGVAGAPVTDDRVYAGNPLGLAIAGVCFAIVLAAIGWGIYFIVSA